LNLDGGRLELALALTKVGEVGDGDDPEITYYVKIGSKAIITLLQ